MAAVFTQISMTDMDAYLVSEGFKRVYIPGTTEAVYSKRVYVQGDNMQLSLRVYTSITDRAGTREKGTDAIRVVLFYRQIVADADGNESAKEPRPIGGSRRVHRVAGWKSNLGKRLGDWPTMMGPKCPKCGLPMAEREGKTGTFWGCIGFKRDVPNCCRMTLPISDEAGPVQAPPVVQATVVEPSVAIPQCPRCQRPMVSRQSKHGKFWGCQGYPTCKGTRPA